MKKSIIIFIALAFCLQLALAYPDANCSINPTRYIVYDLFNRADNNSVGGAWSEIESASNYVIINDSSLEIIEDVGFEAYAEQTTSIYNTSKARMVFYMKTDSTARSNGFLAMRGGSQAFRIIFTGGQIRFISTAIDQLIINPAEPNTWYKIDLQNINLTSYKLDVWVNDTLIYSDLSTHSFTEITSVRLGMFAGASSLYHIYFKNVTIFNGTECPEGIPEITADTIFSAESVNNTNPAAFEDVLFNISVTNPYGINKSIFSYYNGSVWLNDTVQNQTNFECYQETANEATICGGLPTGSYVFDSNWKSGVPSDRDMHFVYDGVWDSYGDQVQNVIANASELYINYTVPSFASGARWNAQVDGGILISNVPESCFVAGKLYLMVQSNATNYNVYLYCKTDYSLSYYDLLINNSQIGYGSTIFEEGIYWIATIQTDVKLQTVKTMPDAFFFNYTWYAMNSSGYWIPSEQYYLNVSGLPMLIINYTPVSNDTKIFVQNNVTQPYNVTVNKQGWASWFLDGVIQFFQTIGSNLQAGWVWIIPISNTTLAHNVTVFINDSNGQVISHYWRVNVTSYLTNLVATPSNISAQYSTINISCQVPSDNATVIISYMLPSSDWINLTTIYNSETGYFDSSVITQLELSWIGTLDFRCIGYDFVNNVTIEQYAYNAVNVYLPNYVPPTISTSIVSVNGLYDSAINLKCDGAESLSGYSLYYDFIATYIDTKGELQTEQPIMQNSTNPIFNWYLLNLPTQANINIKCRAFDGIEYSNWLTLADNVSVAHGLNLNLFFASINPNNYVNSKIILAEYCNIGNLENTKIIATWADCNEDGQWDYLNEYNSTTQDYSNVYDYFTCIYPLAGTYNVIIGCLLQRKDSSITWDNRLCPDITDTDELCNYQKAYSVNVIDGNLGESNQ